MLRRLFCLDAWANCAVTAALAAAVGCFGGSSQDVRGGVEIVEGGVIFRFYDTDVSRVYLVGDFNDWSPRADPLVDENGDGQWTLFINLAPGVYQYKFVVDGNWLPDPRNPEKVSDGFGGENSVVRVSGP